MVAHGLLIFLLGRLLTQPALRVQMAGTAHGTRIDLAYSPGRAPVFRVKTDSHAPLAASAAKVLKASTVAVEKPDSPVDLVEPPRPHLEPLRQSSPSSTVAVHSSVDEQAGTDSLGSGDVEIALTTYSPSPRPDLSSLPRGTQGDVILDVTIDPAGRVADLQVLHALGFGVETDVVNTVRTWTFRPAKKDGVAVASTQELHFHFGPV